MPKAPLSHSPYSRQHAAAFVAWSCIMSAGCVREVPADATDISVGPIDMARPYSPEDMAQPAVDATTDAPDVSTHPNVWVVTLTPVE